MNCSAPSQIAKSICKMFLKRKCLVNIIQKRKVVYFGHMIGRGNMQRQILEGRVNGRRGRGRPRAMWYDNIKEWTRLNYCEGTRLAEDRLAWRSMAANLLIAEGTR